MKKKSLVFMVLLLMSVFSFTSCKNDASLSNTFKGKYDVKVSDINLKELEQTSIQVKAELEKGKKELREGLENAQKELDGEVNVEIDGKKIDLKEYIGEMGQGLDKVLDGVSDISNGLGNGISELLIKNTNFQVDFREDGVLEIGSDKNTFNFSSKHLTWEVIDGKLIIKDKDENKENFSFDLKTENNKDWELIHEKIKVTLTKKQ
jgi:hypothetical protein